MLATLLLGGCGGGGQLSMGQLRTRAAQICTTADRKAEKILTPTVPARTATFLRQGVSVLGTELAQLHALKPPQEVADVYGIAIRTFSRKLHVLNGTLRRLSRGDDPIVTVKTLEHRLAPLESNEDGAWQALEIPACLNR